VNTAIFSRTGGSLGIGFAVPVSVVKMVMDSLITTGSVTRGWIGVEPQDRVVDKLQHPDPRRGVVIAAVMPSGPADAAGVRRGDLLVAVGGKPVTDTSSLLNTVAMLKPGSQIQLTLVREEKAHDLQVTVGRRPTPASP
jgi:serine protease DegQ